MFATVTTKCIKKPHTAVLKCRTSYPSPCQTDTTTNSGREAVCSFINMLLPSDRFLHESEAL